MSATPRGGGYRARLMPRARSLLFALISLLSSCGGGLGGTSSDGAPAVPAGTRQIELLTTRSRLDTSSEQSEIWAQDEDGIVRRRVLDRSGTERQVRLHPDGDRFVFARETRPGDIERREIYTASLSGNSPETRITVDGFPDAWPDFSDDGARIVFESTRNGAPRLFLVDASGSMQPTALREDGSDQTQPDWSPNEDRIAFVRVDPLVAPARPSIYTIRSDGSGLTMLTDGGTEADGDRDPSFSPDGSTVLFSRAVPGDRRILMSVPAAGGTPTPLTAPLGVDRFPRLSPDGNRLFFFGARAEFGDMTARLFQARSDGSDQVLMSIGRRFEWTGLDVIPGAPPPSLNATETFVPDVKLGSILNGLGRPVRGQRELIDTLDGMVYGIETIPSDIGETAGLTYRFPVGAIAETIDRVTITIVAALIDADGDDVLRVAVRNAADNRNDILIERVPTGALETITFTLGSLAYVDRDNALNLTIVGERDTGEVGELQIDFIELRTLAEPQEPTAPLLGEPEQGR